MRESKHLIVTILLFIGVPLNLNFTMYPLGIFYIINFLIFILFWIIPIYLCYKKKKSNKYYVLIFIVFILVSLISGYNGEKYGKARSIIDISQARDSYRLSDHKKIIDILETNITKSINNNEDFIKIFNINLRDPKTCYYINNKVSGYIIGIKFESKKFTDKFGKIFIYNSNDDYIISDNEMNDINRIVSNTCEKYRIRDMIRFIDLILLEK